MSESLSTFVTQKILIHVGERAVDQVVKAFREEIARIHRLIESNTRADLYAALDQTQSAATLHDTENQRLHLNLAITEYNKALRRLEPNVAATPDRLLALFGKAYCYVLLQESINAKMELQHLITDIDCFIAAVREFRSSLIKPELSFTNI